LLPSWLAQQAPRVDWIFSFAGVCFVAAAVSAMFLAEPADERPGSPEAWSYRLAGAMAAVRENRNFARLCLAAALSGFSVVLFPHYQALGRERLHLQPAGLVFWVVVQNIGTGVFSLLAGPLADSRGNRVAVRLSLLLTVLLPATAVALTHWGQAGRYYFVVFFFLGLTPVTLRLLNHYTLEVCRPEDHPRYLSTLNVCQALPAVLAPGVGVAIDATSLETVFLAVATLNALGWLMTMTLDEPRRWLGSFRDRGDIVDSLHDL
jgi:MFS family permease